MKSQHAPGPWIYHATAGSHDFAVYPESTGRDIALVRDFNEANARLIAAAPELLAACQAIVDITTENPDFNLRLDVFLKNASAAIAKATNNPKEKSD